MIRTETQSFYPFGLVIQSVSQSVSIIIQYLWQESGHSINMIR